jgi:PIN domain nuclease of toxin-antitoxin system
LKLLLDTQAFLWFLSGDRKLSAKARAALRQPSAELYLSSASVWEMAIKAALGRLELPKPLDQFMQDRMEDGFRPLPVDWRHAAAVQALPLHHRDPFDRMLAAQAQVEGMTLVSADKAFQAYEVRLLW